jgi:L-asparagine transporter-like permease
MKKKYNSLRFIASFIKLIAYLFLLLGILEIIIFSYSRNLIEGGISNEWQNIKIFLDGIFGVYYIFIILISIVSYILISSSAERIRLLIDIEENTRSIDLSIKKILLLQENSLGISAPEIKEEQSLFTLFKNLFD